MDWKVIGGKRLLTFELEPLTFGLRLPAHLFIVGCGGCEADGRVLIDNQGNEVFRSQLPEGEMPQALATFYGQVQRYLALVAG